MDVSIFLIKRLNTLLLCMRLIAENNLGGTPYFTSMGMSSACLEVSKAFIRYGNATHVGRLWLCLWCRFLFIANVPS